MEGAKCRGRWRTVAGGRGELRGREVVRWRRGVVSGLWGRAVELLAARRPQGGRARVKTQQVGKNRCYLMEELGGAGGENIQDVKI